MLWMFPQLLHQCSIWLACHPCHAFTVSRRCLESSIVLTQCYQAICRRLLFHRIPSVFAGHSLLRAHHAVSYVWLVTHTHSTKITPLVRVPNSTIVPKSVTHPSGRPIHVICIIYKEPQVTIPPSGYTRQHLGITAQQSEHFSAALEQLPFRSISDAS